MFLIIAHFVICHIQWHWILSSYYLLHLEAIVHCLWQAIVLIMSSSLTTRGHGSHHLSQPEAMARHLLQATALIIYFGVPRCPSQPEAMALIICHNRALPVSSFAATGRGCHHRVILSLMFSGTGSYHCIFSSSLTCSTTGSRRRIISCIERPWLVISCKPWFSLSLW